MRSPSPARRRSPRVAGIARLMAERRHTGSCRLPCSALLLLALAGATGARAVDLAGPSDADLRAAAPIAPIAPIAPVPGALDQAAACQALAEATAFGDGTAAIAGATVLPPRGAWGKGLAAE